VFTEKEIAYLNGLPAGRLATVDSKGCPHVVPTNFALDAEKGVLKIGAAVLADRGQKRLYLTHIKAQPHVAFVVDDIATEPSWAPRGVSVRGRAQIHPEGGEQIGPGLGPIWVEIFPASISAWGIDTPTFEPPNFRKIAPPG
jgi:pyridoxamine 5'-phosphate oxidase family protein